MLSSALAATADRLNAALSAGVASGVREVFSSGATIWLGTGGPERSVEDTVLAVLAVHERVAAWTIDVNKLQQTPEGYVQQHTNTFLLRDGSEAQSMSCLVVRVNADARIERLEEYFDPTPLGFLSNGIATVTPMAPPSPTSSLLGSPVWTTGQIDSDGESIYFETVSPDDPTGTIVLCHGAGGHHASWFNQVPALAKTHRVITWDQRGFGRSTNRHELASPSAAAVDLGRLLEHLEAQDAHLIGQSLGGWAVLKHELRHPGVASSLTFTSSVAGILPLRVRASFEQYLRRASAGGSPMRAGHTEALSDVFCQTKPTMGWLYQQLGTVVSPAPSGAIGLMLTDDADVRDVTLTRTPTLFIVGEHDPIFGPAAVMEAASHVPGSRVEVIASAGHSPYWETPVQWNHLVLEFIRSVPPRAAG